MKMIEAPGSQNALALQMANSKDNCASTRYKILCVFCKAWLFSQAWANIVKTSVASCHLDDARIKPAESSWFEGAGVSKPTSSVPLRFSFLRFPNYSACRCSFSDRATCHPLQKTIYIYIYNLHLAAHFWQICSEAQGCFGRRSWHFAKTALLYVIIISRTCQVALWNKVFNGMTRSDFWTCLLKAFGTCEALAIGMDRGALACLPLFHVWSCLWSHHTQGSMPCYTRKTWWATCVLRLCLPISLNIPWTCKAKTLWHHDIRPEERRPPSRPPPRACVRACVRACLRWGWKSCITFCAWPRGGIASVSQCPFKLQAAWSDGGLLFGFHNGLQLQYMDSVARHHCCNGHHGTTRDSKQQLPLVHVTCSMLKLTHEIWKPLADNSGPRSSSN